MIGSFKIPPEWQLWYLDILSRKLVEQQSISMLIILYFFRRILILFGSLEVSLFLFVASFGTIDAVEIRKLKLRYKIRQVQSNSNHI